jgi:hypothetical protein
MMSWFMMSFLANVSHERIADSGATLAPQEACRGSAIRSMARFDSLPYSAHSLHTSDSTLQPEVFSMQELARSPSAAQLVTFSALFRGGETPAPEFRACQTIRLPLHTKTATDSPSV